MGVRTLSVWTGVPGAELLKEKLRVARDKQSPLTERQQAISYLNGTVTVLAGLEKRQALADYLRRELLKAKTSLYYSGRSDGDQAHG